MKLNSQKTINFLFPDISIVLDFSKFQEEVNYLKDVLKKDFSPTTLVDKCMKVFLIEQFSQKILEHTVAISWYVFLYLRTSLQKSISSNISFCKIKIIFKSSRRLANFFRFIDKMPSCLRSNTVYTFGCGRCNATYYGETCHHFNEQTVQIKKISSC